MGGGQDEVIAFLGRAESYGAGVESVERIDTHVSAVFLAGSHAYKLKRAVKFPYLDFTALESRKTACEAELRINRRTAPEIYEKVLAVTRAPGGGLALGGDGEPIDYVVVMRRFDQEGLFDRMAERGALTAELMVAVADAVARFHEAAERTADFGGADALGDVLNENREAFDRHGPPIFDGAVTQRLTERSDAALSSAAPLLDRRRKDGYVRRCHGDLHLRNICLYEGRPLLFDGIEFSERIACIDVLYDLAFLLMDLVHRGEEQFANLVLNRYLTQPETQLADLDGLAALPLFLSCRAAIRAHIGADAARNQTDREKSRAEIASARAYQELALELISPPPAVLVAVGGLSGSGKSTIARALAPLLGPAPGGLISRSDVLRKQLLGAGEFDRLPEEGYASAVTVRVYKAITDRSRAAIRAGHAAIADAVYAKEAERRVIESVAAHAGVPFRGFWLEAPRSELERRVAGRSRDASDATVEVLRSQLDYDLGEITWRRIDTSAGPEAALAEIRAALKI